MLAENAEKLGADLKMACPWALMCEPFVILSMNQESTGCRPGAMGDAPLFINLKNEMKPIPDFVVASKQMLLSHQDTSPLNQKSFSLAQIISRQLLLTSRI